MIKEVRVAILLTSLVLILGCAETNMEYRFQKLSADETGIIFSNVLPEDDSMNIIQYLYYYNGGGIGAGDFNNDGKIDLYFGANRSNDQFYLNVSDQGNIKFEEVTDVVGIGNIGNWTTGVTVVDINRDGFEDIYVCQLSGYKSFVGSNQFFINQGVQNGMPLFKESAEELGLNFKGLSTHATFLDYDLDGDLDMYLLNHSVHGSNTYVTSSVREQQDELAGDRLYRNDDGTFTDVTQEANIYSSHIGYGLGVDVGDVDKNGYPDIYIGNDFHEQDYLYLNNGDGTFREVIEETTGHTSQFSMGVNIVDINDDSWLDIVSLDMMAEDEYVRLKSVDVDPYDIYNFKKEYGYHFQLAKNTLQLNRGSAVGELPKFSEIGTLVGIEATDWSWSVLPGDFDNDGDKDMFISNGIYRRPNDLDYLKYISDPTSQSNASDQGLIEEMPLGLASNVFLEQLDQLNFINASWHKTDLSASNGAITADLDNDGDLDIVTNDINAAARVLENKTLNKNWVSIELVASEEVLQLGAEVVIWTDGDRKHRTVSATQGFMSSYSGPVHVGLGDVSVIDSILVSWPNGEISRVGESQINQKLRVDRTNVVSKIVKSSNSQKGVVQHEIGFRHVEDEYDDIRLQKLMPYVLSKEGPAYAIGDINNDGRNDIYIGGAHGNQGEVLLAQDDGTHIKSIQPALDAHMIYEDVAASFADVNGDGAIDLYVGSGGHRERDGSALLMDRIYINDGRGLFSYQEEPLVSTVYNTSAISSNDYDEDGDQDLLVTYRVKGGSYGISKGVELLQNQGDGSFRPLSFDRNSNIGMVTDAAWSDIDSDGDLDFIVVGEWMPITLFTQSDGTFDVSEIPNTTGLWQCIELSDLDGDGDQDMVAGNFGLNNTIAQAEKAGLFLGDYDGNRTLDPIIYYSEKDRIVPLNGKDALAGQMNKIKSDFVDYRTFAGGDFEKLFGQHQGVRKIEIDIMSSVWLKQDAQGTFSIHPLPQEIQYAPMRAIELRDFDMDGQKDILIGGNRNSVSPSFGAANSSTLSWLINEGGDFEFNPTKSNLGIGGVIRGLAIDAATSQIYVFRNNAPTLSILIQQ